ncbi:MAG: 50S ribosomal protein L11 methyltransferase [Longimicrobiales bacterium]
MYTIHAYGEMNADRVRIDAYAAALARTIRPEATVLDLGAGAGLMTLMACKLGAAHVIAVEPNNLITVAREIVKAAGFANRVEFVHDVSTAVTPSRRCDVVVSDLRGVVPQFGQHIPSIVDVRTRWLADGGTLIPQRDIVYASVVESTRSYEAHFKGWLPDADGVPFAAARRLCANRPRKVYLEERELLCAPAAWINLDYPTILSADFDSGVELSTRRDGVGHGLVLWFESMLAAGIELSNRPGRPQLIYGQLFLPWPEPVTLRAGDTVQVRLRARLIHDDYVWSWTSILPNRGSASTAPPRFDQSTLQGETWSPEFLSRLDVRARPELTAKGRAATRVLSAIDGTTATEDIAACLATEFPDEFADAQHAARFISKLHAEFWR